MKKFITLLLMLASLNTLAQQVKDFSLINVIDGKNVSLNNYTSKPGIIIIFTLNTCPFDDYYAGRIKSLAQENIPVLLVNSSPEPTETTENMVKRATQLGLNLPYLADKDQLLLQDLNAHKSTEAFLLKNTGGKFSVFYRGAIDDNPQVAGDVKHPYLSDAMVKMQAGQRVDVSETRPVGCNIRRK